jgi:hypothetical protein
MKVRAVFPDGGFGFDGLGRRRDGDEFEIEESIFDPSWMEKVEDSEEPEIPAPKARSTRKSKDADE